MLPFGIQPIHIIVIIVVAFLIFGANKLPELGRSLGKTLSEFRKGTKEAAEGFKEEMQKPGQAPAAPAAPATPDDSSYAQPLPPIPPPSPAKLSGNFCINCGAPNLPEARFCANCGAKLPEKVA
jgi:sec-independent protein translocase protein TatA